MILVHTQRVVGQQLHPLNVADRMQIRAQPFQMGVGKMCIRDRFNALMDQAISIQPEI